MDKPGLIFEKLALSEGTLHRARIAMLRRREDMRKFFKTIDPNDPFITTARKIRNNIGRRIGKFYNAEIAAKFRHVKKVPVYRTSQVLKPKQSGGPSLRMILDMTPNVRGGSSLKYDIV